VARSRRGDNLPAYRAVQFRFSAHVRDPSANPPPPDVEPRRMRVYVDLVYNNIERFLANTFRVARTLLDDVAWHALVRDFVKRHVSSSPYFHEIPLEFVHFLQHERQLASDPPFLLELAHYEWVELALDIDTREIPTADVDATGDVLMGIPVVSPLAWSLAYRYPVHRIAPGRTPDSVPDEPTFLVVYRGRDDRVHFLEGNRVTARLLTLLAGAELSGTRALEQIAEELSGYDRNAVLDGGRETLERLRDCAIIAGVRRAGT
jgi:hypothetical protein